jgi:peptidoglycan biosynthesis protein MviN/MurJ (putative lipid II flippase)
MIVLFAASPFGPISVGAARLAGGATQALVAILVSPRGFAWGRQARLQMLSKAWLLSATMGCLVWLLLFSLAGQYAIPRLLFSRLAGGGVYATLLLMFVPSQFHSIVGRFRRLLG